MSTSNDGGAVPEPETGLPSSPRPPRFVSGDWEVTIIYVTDSGFRERDGGFYRVRHCGAFVENVRTPDEVRAHMGPVAYALLRQPADDLAEVERRLAG